MPFRPQKPLNAAPTPNAIIRKKGPLTIAGLLAISDRSLCDRLAVVFPATASQPPAVIIMLRGRKAIQEPGNLLVETLCRHAAGAEDRCLQELTFDRSLASIAADMANLDASWRWTRIPGKAVCLLIMIRGLEIVTSCAAILNAHGCPCHDFNPPPKTTLN